MMTDMEAMIAVFGSLTLLIMFPFFFIKISEYLKK